MPRQCKLKRKNAKMPRRQCKFKRKNAKMPRQCKFKRKNAKMPRQCKFKRKNAKMTRQCKFKRKNAKMTRQFANLTGKFEFYRAYLHFLFPSDCTPLFRREFRRKIFFIRILFRVYFDFA
jgi:hypothetical protein